MEKKVRLGIIGVGGMGSGHAAQILDGYIPRMELAAVCDIVPDRMDPYKDKGIQTFTDSKKLIRSGVVDAVLVATPHYFHTTIGIDALNNGLHTIVEKPISVTKFDALKLISAYKKAQKKNPDIKFCAMFNQRTNPFYIKMHDLIQSGQLGEIRRSNWIITNWFRTEAYYRSGGWRATWAGEGGGVLVNQCPHNIDLYQWLCGMPCAVTAIGGLGKHHNIETEDECCALFEYENGATGAFITTTGEAPGTNRLEICGDMGRLVLEDTDAGYTLEFLRNDHNTHEFIKTDPARFGHIDHCRITFPAISGSGDQHVGIKNNFCDAVLDGAPLIAPAEEGIKAVEIANAMQYSLMTHKRVELPMDPKEYQNYLQDLIKNSKFVKETDENASLSLKGSFAK